MKLTSLVILSLTTVLAPMALGATFKNLDFEMADPALLDQAQGSFGTIGSVTSRIPGWTFWLGKAQQSVVGLNRSTVGSPLTALHDRRPFGPSFNRFPAPPISGNFGFLLKTQISNLQKLPSLRQAGTVPSGTKSIQLRVFGDPIKIFIDDIAIPLGYQLVEAPDAPKSFRPVTIAYANIGSFSGKHIRLRIEPDTTKSVRTFAGIDDISFSPEAISNNTVSADQNDSITLRRLK